MIVAQQNPFGRKRHETPTAEELLADINRPLPYSEEAEKGVIASWIQRPDLLDDGGVQPAAFYNEALRTIAVEMMALKTAGKLVTSEYGIDVPLFTHHLTTRGLIDRVGGPSALTELFTFVPVPSHYTYYRQILTDCYKRRELMHRLLLGVERLQTMRRTGEDEDLAAVVSEIHTRISDVETNDDSADIPSRPIKAIINSVVEKLQYRAENPGKLPGVSTGFPKLDEITGGMQQGRLWVVLAESSEGKSTLCRQFVEVACDNDHAGVIYTYEMMDDEETSRMICSQGRVSNTALKTGQLTRAEYDAFTAASLKIAGWDISIVDVAGWTIEDIHRDIMRRKKRLDQAKLRGQAPPEKQLIVEIDYIQLALTRAKNERRQLDIAAITSSTKQCAKRAQCTIIMPSQMNDKGEAREAADIKNDSDLEIKIQQRQSAKPQVKKEHWRKAKEEELDDAAAEMAKWQRDLFISKNRDGRKNVTVRAKMLGEFFRFEPDY